MAELLLKEEVYAIVGAAMDVHSEMGRGFNEAVYHEALELELTTRDIPFESEKSIRIHYKGQLLEKEYFADLVCYEPVLVELKALDVLASKEESQILNYLKASKLPIGLLINFGSAGKLEWKRFVY